MAEEDANQIIIDGVSVVGADGSVYFVPEADLEAYRVPEPHAASVRDALEGDADVQGFATQGQLPQLGSQKGNVKFLFALQGPFGRQDIAAGPANPTTSVVDFGLHGQ